MSSDSDYFISCVLLGKVGPEQLVRIDTVNGAEQVAVSGALVVDSKLRVSMVDARNSQLLVELPSESVSGNWRVWVERTSKGNVR